jgi:transcriptional regulator with XRE-family HTH domain
MPKATSMNFATEEISAAIRTAREKKAISQRELSAMAGVPQAQISRFERGAVDLRLSSLVSLARALDLELELVPRNALPAVQSIVRNTEGREPRTNTAVRGVNMELSKLAKFLQSAELPQIPPKEIALALSNVRALQQLRPSATQMSAIKEMSKALTRFDPERLNKEIFAPYAEQLRVLRNQLAHMPPIESIPRPAYSLEEDADE